MDIDIENINIDELNNIVELVKIKKEINAKLKDLRDREKLVKVREGILENRTCALKEKADDLEHKQAILKHDEENIKACETAEARDRMRLARFYWEVCDIENSYERQKYIFGLSLILSGATVCDIDDLFKEGKK